MENKALCQVYNPYPVTVELAEGIRIYTDRGIYLDTFAGIGVLNLGHSHPDVVDAIISKVKRYAHLSNYLLDPDAEEMARTLLGFTGRGGCVYFANSGTEANEAALKAVKKCRKGKTVSFAGNFHGRTLGALSVTYSEKLRKPFEPLLPETVFLPLEKEAFIRFAADNDIAGVFVECIQGNSGVLPIPEDLAHAVMESKKEKGYLVVADEVQAGLGRTGNYFAYQGFGLEPDIVTMGKGIGGGLPLGAAMFLDFEPFEKGDHGSTFAPNPVAVSAGLAFLKKLTPEFLGEIGEKGKYLADGLSKLKWVTEIRQRGLMLGAGTEDAEDVKQKAFDRGVLLNVAGGSIRFLPAFTITKEEINEILEKIDF